MQEVLNLKHCYQNSGDGRPQADNQEDRCKNERYRSRRVQSERSVQQSPKFVANYREAD